MRLFRVLVVSFTCVTATANRSTATGLNLSWNDCGTAGLADLAFTCDTNSGASFVLIGSFFVPASAVDYGNQTVVLDLQAETATLPDWWQAVNVGSCRGSTAITTSFDFAPAYTSCADYWSGVASGWITSYEVGYGGAGRLRIVIGTGAAVIFFPFDPNTEYYSFRLLLSRSGTVGVSSCSGCNVPVCIVMNELRMRQPFGYPEVVVQSAASRNFVTWQGGGIGGAGCPLAVPTRNHTWGSIKALYR